MMLNALLSAKGDTLNRLSHKEVLAAIDKAREGQG